MVVVVRELKDKCKDAARMRREKERAEFIKLSKLLPLPSSTTSQLDKASIIRLTSSYLRMRSAFPEGLGESWGTARNRRSTSVVVAVDENSNCAPPAVSQQPNIRELGSLILQTLGGFVFALHNDGKIMYISETASVLLGLPQIDLTGSSIFEYVHPADHQDIQEILNLNNTTDTQLDDDAIRLDRKNGNELELRRSFCMRMKCILPKRNAGLVSKGYKAIHCSGYLKVRQTFMTTTTTTTTTTAESTTSRRQPKWSSYALVAVGHSLLPTASTELRLGKSSFMFRANLDLKLYYVESTMLSLLGYSHTELVGQSLYQFVHVADLQQVEQAHRQILAKGQTVSRYFRLMRPDGAHIWLQAQGTLIDNPRSMPKPQHIVGICSLIANDLSDCRSSILITEQQQQRQVNSPVRKSCPSAIQVTSNKRIKTSVVESCNKPEMDRNNKRVRKSTAAIKNNYCHTIGSTRRTSDDTCSVVSSIASTSAYSTSTSSSASSSSSSSLSESSFSHLKSALNSAPQCYTQMIPATPADIGHQCQQPELAPDYSANTPIATTQNIQECWLVASDQYQQDDCIITNKSMEYQQQSTPACWTQSTTLLPSSVTSSSCQQDLMSPTATNVIATTAGYPDQIYLNNQYYHRLEEYPIESGYYYDNCMTAYHSDVPIYVESKEHQNRINTPYDGSSDNSYQYQYHNHYQLQQTTTCMGNMGVVGAGDGGGVNQADS